MAPIQANKPHFKFESKTQPADLFEVTDFTGDDGISRPFRFEINLVSRESDVDFSQIVNQPATFTILRGLEETPIHGIIADFEQRGHAEGWFGYRALLVPRFWLLSLNYQSRVFQNMTVSDIVRTVLVDSGFLTASDFELDLGSYPEREYCVQYNESDLSFLNRLLEFEGIHYFFKHDQKDVVVITDRFGTHEDISGDAFVPYNEGGGLATETEAVRAFVCRERVVTGTFMVRDYHYAEPESYVNAESQLNSKMPGRRYEFGGGLLEQSEGDRIAQIRNEEAECRRRVFFGDGDCARLVSGHAFSLENHFRGEFDGRYLITEVQHRGSQKEAIEGLDERATSSSLPKGESYRNAFTCIPADVCFRPLRVTPVPRIAGIISAKVESGGGQYAYLDDQGRYRVKMPFDLSDRTDGTASLPIPQAQINSGPDHGVHFPLHERNDLLLAFMDGDLNRPFAIGSLPNPTNVTPVTSNNNAQNVVRTRGGNELVMDDTEDSAQIWMKTALGHVFMMDDRGDRVVLTTTEQHQVSFDDKNQFIEIKTKEGHFARLDDKGKKFTLQSKDGHRVSISDKDKLITLVDESGDHLFQIDIGNKQLTIKTGSGGIDLQAPAGLIEIKAKELKVETSGDTSIKAANITSEAQSEYKMKANNVTAEAAMNYKQKALNITSEAAVSHKIKGMQVKSEGAAQNDVQGAMVSVKASGINTIQGSLVKIN